jgi:ABC-2 type transport system ATP-binding protein
MIKANSLSRNYGDFKAVSNVNFEIKQGEIIGLLGHNGAGKTTIMKMITGVIEPTSGSVEVAGLDVVENRQEVQKLIGYLPEDAALYDELTVLQYLDFIANMRGIAESQKKSAFKRVIEQTRLQEKADAVIATLSKGYKQRVGVAQALLQNPKVLILDEPTNGLDPKQIDEMRKLIKELSKTTTVILSTHILQEVKAICSRVLIISKGELAVDSSLDKLQTSKLLKLSISKVELEQQNNFNYMLGAISGVSKVDLEAETEKTLNYLLSLSEDTNKIAPKIAKSIISEGYDLQKLEPCREDLEEIFKANSQI